MRALFMRFCVVSLVVLMPGLFEAGVPLAQEIKGQPSPLMKPVDEMTVKEFGEIMGYWFKKVKGSDEAEESSSTS